MTAVVAVQDRARSRAAIRAAAQEAAFRQAKLIAVIAYSADGAVVAPAARPVGGALRTADEEQAHAEDVLRDATLDALGSAAAQVELMVMHGLPGRSLVDAARTLGAELLVVGSRSDKAITWLLGSRILRRAGCIRGRAASAGGRAASASGVPSAGGGEKMKRE